MCSVGAEHSIRRQRGLLTVSGGSGYGGVGLGGNGVGHLSNYRSSSIDFLGRKCTMGTVGETRTRYHQSVTLRHKGKHHADE